MFFTPKFQDEVTAVTPKANVRASKQESKTPLVAEDDDDDLFAEPKAKVSLISLHPLFMLCRAFDTNVRHEFVVYSWSACQSEIIMPMH
jgi:hypothetical protein